MAKYISSKRVMTVEYREMLLTDVPEDIKYLTIDEDGDVYGFESEPQFFEISGCWGVTDGTMGCYLGSWNPHDYRNSLEKIT